ncbi:MAG: hypothetical protein ACOH1K_07040, partial [Rhodoglobus sp.]
PEPTTTFVAPYATDEEALAAAEVAYTEYMSVTNQIFVDSGADPERMSAVAAGPFLQMSIESFGDFARERQQRVGIPTASSFTLQRYSPDSGPGEILTVYLCRDVSNVDVLDAQGNSLVLESRADRSTMQVTFDWDSARQRLLVSDQQLWESGKC